MMDFIEFNKGDILDNCIEITDIQEGGLGRIYFGYCRNRMIKVAIKTLLRSLWEEHRLAEKWPEVKDQLIKARLPLQSIGLGEYIFFTFFREARLVCQSRNHPNVIKGTRFWWTDAGQPFYECEFVEDSRDLRSFFEQATSSLHRKRLSILEVAHIAVSFCNGMIYISSEMLNQYNRSHQDHPADYFVHRDIKPENILIDNTNTIKIIDMGLAKFVFLRTTTYFVSVSLHGGVAKYMSPEQTLNFESTMPSSDIYSLAVTLCDLLGEDVYSYASKDQETEGVPHEFREIILRCLQSDMKKRYRDFTELKKALIQFISMVKKGKIRLRENLRCARCGYISPAHGTASDTGGMGSLPNDHSMVRIPAGEFYKGCSREHMQRLSRKMGTDTPLKNETCKKAYLDAFDIDTYAVTNGQYLAFVRDSGYKRLPSHWRSGTDEPFPEQASLLPVVNVSYDDALSYCEWAGLRLPTGDEWEKAARGSKGRLYPWGDEYSKEFCNSAESGNRTPVAVDLYPEGASPYGCYQMTGNILEWVDESHPKSDNYKYLRGGCWAESCEVLGLPFLHNIAAARSSSQVSSQTHVFGFRCARDARDNGEAPEGKEEPGKCPLCGGEFLSFKLRDIKVPENNIYSWVGYFDIG